MEAVLYIHGKGGGSSEAEHYRSLFPSSEVVGVDYDVSTPQKAVKTIRERVKELSQKYDGITLIANSIGAYFTMISGVDGYIRHAYFISPVVDMESLITDMMKTSGVTVEELSEKGIVVTPSGDTLSWEYLCFVRDHPIIWNAPTDVLYGEKDELVTYKSVYAFSVKHNALLTVMKNGEHWFHTDEQMRFTDNWIKSGVHND